MPTTPRHSPLSQARPLAAELLAGYAWLVAVGSRLFASKTLFLLLLLLENSQRWLCIAAGVPSIRRLPLCLPGCWGGQQTNFLPLQLFLSQACHSHIIRRCYPCARI